MLPTISTELYKKPLSLYVEGKNYLFLPDEDVDGAAVHGPVFSYLVFEEPTVVFFHILGQIGVEDEGRYLRVG